MAAKKSDPAQYTQPELRDKIKAEVTAGDKGGRPGQWSARKAQLVTHEYEKQGGDYKQPPTEEQQSLKQWGEEHWTTSDGKPAEREGGTTRYLPEAAWDQLSDEEKAATNRKKQTGSKQGQQFVANTEKAAEARGQVKKSGKRAVARKKAPTKSAARAAAKAEAKRSSESARKKAPAKKAPAKSTAEADRKAAQQKKAFAASRKADAQRRKRAAERASRKP